MNSFERFVELLSIEMPDVQAPYGLFHIIMLALTVAATALLCIKQYNCSDMRFRKILLILWITLLLFEGYKQLVSPFSSIDGRAVWEYDLNDIPYQFCSSILFCLPPIIFLKDGRVRNAFMSFSVAFIFLAGLMVMIYPDQLKDDRAIGICVQTMVHHGAQVLAGAFIAVRQRARLGKRFFVSGLAVFGGFILVALVLNASLSPAVIGGRTINFFYISPYHNCPLPILSEIRKALPWAVFLIIYIVGFVLLAALISFVFYLVTKSIKNDKSCAPDIEKELLNV